MNKEQKDLISIIVPVYNVEKYIKRCVHSLQKQTYGNIEIILIDDGSMDKSAKICDDFSNMDSRIKTIHKKNGGLSDARNVGIEQAKGKYLAFIDSDDYIESSMIKELYELAERKKCQITIANMKRIYEDGKIESFYEPEKKEKCYEGNLKFETLKQPSVCNKLFAAELFKTVRFPKGKFYEDTFIYHELVYKAKRIGITGKQGYWYFAREGSILGRAPYTDRYFDFLEAVSKRMHFLQENKVLYYGMEACLSYYIAYSNAVKYIKRNKKNYDKFKKAKKEYIYAYHQVIDLKEVTWKQKMKLRVLRYIPVLHSYLF